MLKKLYLDNFLVFSDFEIELQDKTVIFGEYSSGKSAICKTLNTLSKFLGNKLILDSVFSFLHSSQKIDKAQPIKINLEFMNNIEYSALLFHSNKIIYQEELKIDGKICTNGRRNKEFREFMRNWKVYYIDFLNLSFNFVRYTTDLSELGMTYDEINEFESRYFSSSEIAFFIMNKLLNVATNNKKNTFLLENLESVFSDIDVEYFYNKFCKTDNQIILFLRNEQLLNYDIKLLRIDEISIPEYQSQLN